MLFLTLVQHIPPFLVSIYNAYCIETEIDNANGDNAAAVSWVINTYYKSLLQLSLLRDIYTTIANINYSMFSE